MTDDGEIILQLGLKEGRNADAAVAAESLLAWIDLARDAARAIDPFAEVRVELLGREEGSLKQILKLIDDHAALISKGADEFPYLKKAAIGLAISVATSGVSTYVQEGLKAPVENVALSAEDRELLVGMTRAIQGDAHAARSAMRFYRALERDPAITRVEVRDGRSSTPLSEVDRAEFAARGGLYRTEEDPEPDETRREVWSVVLMHAPFYASTRHWGFSRDGLRFTAQMADLKFLQGIVDRTLNIGLHEGVRMNVEVEWKERREGSAWLYVPDSRKIVRVLSFGLAPASPTGDPEEDD